MTQQVKVNITIDGETISPFSGISISQDVHQHHTFEIALPADAFKNSGKVILQQSKKFIGKECHIQFGADIFLKTQPENEFLGLITEIGMSRFENGERSMLLRGSSPTILMDGNPQCRSFTTKGLKDIANATLEKVPHTLETKIEPNHTSPIPYVVQYKESNFNFLRRMAAQYGEWCFYDGTKLVFGKLPRDKKLDLPLVKDLFELDFSLKLLPVNFKAIGYAYQENKIFESSASAASINNLDEFGQFSLDQSSKFYSQEPSANIYHPIEQQEQLDTFVTSRKSALAHNMVVMSGSSDNPYLNIGSIINITGESMNEQDYGEFIIVSISHHINNNYTYQNSFTAIPVELQVPPPPEITFPVAEIQSAKVMDNKDEKGWGRIRVQFPWQLDAEMSPWVRMTHHYSGKGDKGELHGFYFIPEIGTEVMVGFENDNPDLPVVFGSVYHGKSSPEEWKDADNKRKVLKTRNGNQIHFIDEDGKEEIRILNKSDSDATNEISLSLAEDGKITIKTKGKLDISAKSITINAEETISMTSGKGTNFQAQKTTINADASLNMTSKEVTVDGTNTTVKGTGQFTIEGGKSSITAKMLDIDGGSVASVKAAMIKLN